VLFCIFPHIAALHPAKVTQSFAFYFNSYDCFTGWLNNQLLLVVLLLLGCCFLAFIKSLYLALMRLAVAIMPIQVHYVVAGAVYCYYWYLFNCHC